MDSFRKMNLECFEPYGAFYVFPCIKEFGMTSEEFATRFLEEEKVAAVPGNAFGNSGEGYLRISYAYSIENLRIAMERLQRFVERLRKEQKNTCTFFKELIKICLCCLSISPIIAFYCFFNTDTCV